MTFDYPENSWALKNWCFWTVVSEKTPESPLDSKEIRPVNWKDWSWSSNSLATWYEELTHWKRPWCWERLKAGGEGDNRGWDGWMASPTQWMWVWASCGSWWWIRKPACYSPWSCKELGTTEQLNWLTILSQGEQLWQLPTQTYVSVLTSPQTVRHFQVLPVLWDR